MAVGFSFVRGRHRNSVLPLGPGLQLAGHYWQDGLPEHSLWTGLKTSGHQQLPITTYRCTKCGYLESYALANGANPNS